MAVGNDQLVNGDPVVAIILNTIERDLEGWIRYKTTPQILNFSGGGVLWMIGQVDEYPPPTSF